MESKLPSRSEHSTRRAGAPVHFIRLTLTNFGPFREMAVDFQPSGVFVVSGPNASGKSQLLGAAVAAIVGKRAIALDPTGVGPSNVALELGDGSAREVASLTVAAVAAMPSGRGPQSEITHTSTPMVRDLLANLSENSRPRLLLGETTGVNRLSKRDCGEFEKLAPPELVRSDFWQDMKSSGWLESTAHSAGVGVVIDVVHEFIARAGTGHFPLLVDGVFGQLDRRASEFCGDLLRQIGRHSQVIVVSPSFADIHLGHELIRLPLHESPLRAMANYTRPARFQVVRRKIAVRDRKKSFKLGERFPTPENRGCELKEVKGKNPVGSIGQVVDQYVVAFLNAGIEQTGSIFWGITDEGRTVVGVPLTDPQCDEVRRVVVEKVGNIMPPIAPSGLSIEFHPVTTADAVPLYVIEVRVQAVLGTYLYATGSEDVYVKTEAGKKKLTIMQIQQELLRRMSVVPPGA